MSLLNLSVAIGDYDRNRPLLDGAVKIDGVDPVFMKLYPEEIFFRAFRTEDFDICECSLSSFSVKTAAGNCPYVGVPAFVSRMFRHTSMFCRTDRIKRPEDLKGKKIGVSSLGSLTDFLVRTIAKKKGLNPDRDITLVTTGGSDTERVMALKAGVVEATAVSHPGYGLARKMGFSMLWDSAKEIDYPWMEITTRRAAIKSDRELIMQYMKAHLEGIALFKRDRDFGIKVIKKTLKVTDDELVNESYDIFSKMFIPAPYPNHPGMKASFEYVAMTRNDVWNHKPEEFTDSSFVTELDKSGFIKSLYVK
jgi:hypothetical protein